VADERDLVRSRIDLVDLIGQRVKLKKSGRNWTGLCPFHEDRNPSFSVSPDIGRYKCWSCGASGDVFTYVMETQGLEFRDALELLAKQAGVELTRGKGQDRTKRQAMFDAMSTAQAFFRSELRASSRALEYCRNRGLTEDVLDDWEVGFAPDVGEALIAELKRKGYRLADCAELFLVDGDDQRGYHDRFRGRLMFPIRDDQGNLVAFGGRVIGDGTPKYINSSDTPLFSKGRTLYGMHRAKEAVRKERRAVLVEGYLDVIACHRSGVATAVATLGTAMGEHHVKRLALWCDEVTVLYDSDDAGQKAAERATEMLTQGGLRVRVALMPRGQDPDTLLREHGPEAVKRAVTQGVEPIDFLLKQIEARHSVESEEFWEQATGALANLTNQLEIERHLMPLAAKYPFMRDPERAARTLRQMVRKASRSRSKPDERPDAVTARPKRPVAMPPPLESAPFRALAELETRHVAWAICLDEALFITESGRRLSRIAQRLKDQIQGFEAGQELLSAVEDDLDRDLLAAVLMLDAAPLDESAVLDIGERLAKRREEIALRSTVAVGGGTDEELRGLTVRLKLLKGEKPLEKSPDEGLDTQPDPFV
jgi:DNA primase